jgi:hypothetical protein
MRTEADVCHLLRAIADGVAVVCVMNRQDIDADDMA